MFTSKCMIRVRATFGGRGVGEEEEEEEGLGE